MKSFSWKRLLLIGFVVVLLVAIPVTLYVLKQQQDQRSRATPSTTIAFSPSSSASSPVPANVGATVPLDITLNPGNNLVSNVLLDIQYDPTVLSASDSAFTADPAAQLTVTSGPVVTPGHLQVALSTGFNTLQAISKPTKLGTITFTALGPTDPSNPTTVTFTASSSANSIAGPPKSNDLANENVLLAPQPAFIAVNGDGTITATPTTLLSPTITLTPTPTAGLGGSISPTPTTGAAATATPTGTITLTATATPLPLPTSFLPTNTPTQGVVITTTSIPSATLADTGSTDITFGVGAFLTAVMVIGGIIFFVL